jgi:SAM-dependent methyltransferase
MRKLPELDKIEELYSGNIKSKGMTSKSVGWGSEECQNLRFQKLTSVIGDRTIPVRINDYGCGYGAHLQFLESIGIRVKEYNGYDLSEPMLESARQNLLSFKGALGLHQTPDISTTADYSFVSGTFNVCFETDDDAWKRFIITKLDELNHYSSKGFSFNLLSTFVDWQEDHLYYGDPTFWFEHCKKKYSRYVSLLHDYQLFEWTIIVKKD